MDEPRKLAMLGLGEIDDMGNEEQSMNSWK
jgi:hypothetical protein